MKAAKSITAAAAALAITAASVCPIYADTESVQDTPAASTTSNVYSGFAVADLTDDSYCNVREDADINSQIVGVFHQGCVAEVVGEKDGWTEIASGNVTGYIRSDLLATGSDVDALLSSGEYTSYARVTAPTLNVRSGAGTDNDIGHGALLTGILPLPAEPEIVHGIYRALNFLGGYVFYTDRVLQLGTDHVEHQRLVLHGASPFLIL